MTLYWLLVTEIVVECLVLMLEPASTMIEKKASQKVEGVQNDRCSHSVYHFFLSKIYCVSVVPNYPILILSFIWADKFFLLKMVWFFCACIYILL